MGGCQEYKTVFETGHTSQISSKGKLDSCCCLKVCLANKYHNITIICHTDRLDARRKYNTLRQFGDPIRLHREDSLSVGTDM
jgi:hypothetical protein